MDELKNIAKNIAFPISKRLNYVSIAKQFINTQPLTYVPITLDFTVKKKNRKKKKYKQYSNKDIIYFK